MNAKFSKVEIKGTTIVVNYDIGFSAVLGYGLTDLLSTSTCKEHTLPLAPFPRNRSKFQS